VADLRIPWLVFLISLIGKIAQKIISQALLSALLSLTLLV
jgi:hypothetical protein